MLKVRPKVYFDHASTTSLNPEIKQIYLGLLDQYYNSDALYDDGVAIYRLQETSRSKILETLKVKNAELIFTSGASEANSLAIKGLAFKNLKRRHLICSIYEHASVFNAFKQLEEVFGFEVNYLKPNENGKITITELQKYLRPDTLLVSIMHVNNEIGVINDIAEIGDFVRKHSHAYFHSDVTQSLGKIDIAFDKLDMASFSAHKIHGLKGSGGLIKKQHIVLEPLISGGQQEFGIRGGTSNAPSSIVLAKTIRLALEKQADNYQKVCDLNAYLKNSLKEVGVQINSFDDGIPHVVNFSTNIKSEVLLNYLNLSGIMVSSKSTCGSRENEPSRVLQSMAIDDNYAIRLSIGYENTKAEVDYFIKILKEAISKYG